MRIMEGVRVVELANWVFIPSAGAILAEWGADVLKIEHPQTGDPIHGLVSSGIMPGGGHVDPLMEVANRGKRSVGIDLKTEDGYRVFTRMIEQADVFLTNVRRNARIQLRVDEEHIRAINPRVIFAHASANGEQGPDGDRGGFDMATFWSRGGSTYIISDPDDYPVGQPGAAYGDVIGGAILAGGVAAALYHRERTGESPKVETSLLAAGLWATGAAILFADVIGMDRTPKRPRGSTPNPIVGFYRTADGRHITLQMIESDRYWADFVTRLGAPELANDERFADSRARAANSDECVALLDGIFGSRSLAEWKAALAGAEGVWAPVQGPHEALEDPQALANGYIREIHTDAGMTYRAVPSPVQFGNTEPHLAPAPKHGEHTDQVLLTLGYEMDEIIELKISGAIL